FGLEDSKHGVWPLGVERPECIQEKCSFPVCCQPHSSQVHPADRRLGQTAVEMLVPGAAQVLCRFRYGCLHKAKAECGAQDLKWGHNRTEGKVETFAVFAKHRGFRDQDAG